MEIPGSNLISFMYNSFQDMFQPNYKGSYIEFLISGVWTSDKRIDRPNIFFWGGWKNLQKNRKTDRLRLWGIWIIPVAPGCEKLCQIVI